MTRYTFNTRSALHLSLFITITFGVALCVMAEHRGQSYVAAQDDQASNAEGGVIDAVVTDVEGAHLKIVGGIVIDVSKAIVISMAGERLGISIQPGMCFSLN